MEDNIVYKISKALDDGKYIELFLVSGEKHGFGGGNATIKCVDVINGFFEVNVNDGVSDWINLERIERISIK